MTWLAFHTEPIDPVPIGSMSPYLSATRKPCRRGAAAAGTACAAACFGRLMRGGFIRLRAAQYAASLAFLGVSIARDDYAGGLGYTCSQCGRLAVTRLIAVVAKDF